MDLVPLAIVAIIAMIVLGGRARWSSSGDSDTGGSRDPDSDDAADGGDGDGGGDGGD